jgi:hypothetical protein
MMRVLLIVVVALAADLALAIAVGRWIRAGGGDR